MAARSDASLASLLLTNRLVDSGQKPLSAAEFWSLLAMVGNPAELLDLDARRLATLTGWRGNEAGRVARLLAAGTPLGLRLEELEQRGLQVLSPFDGGYPQRLRRAAGRGGSACPACRRRWTCSATRVSAWSGRVRATARAWRLRLLSASQRRQPG